MVLMTWLRNRAEVGWKSAVCASSSARRSASRGIAASLMQTARAALSSRRTHGKCAATTMMRAATSGAYGLNSSCALGSAVPSQMEALSKLMVPCLTATRPDQRGVKYQSEEEQRERRARAVGRRRVEAHPGVDEEHPRRHDPFAGLNEV